MNKKWISLPGYEQWIFLLLHLLCLVLGLGYLGLGIISVLLLYAIINLLYGRYRPFFLLLLLGSYHSEFNNLYTSEILGVNYIYIITPIFLYLALMNARISRNSYVWLLPLILLFPVSAVFGFFNRYSLGWYFNEFISFFFFLSFAFVIAGFNRAKLDEIIGLLAQYVLIYNPLLTLVSVFTAGESILFFDEFEKFYFLALVPLLFSRIPYKMFFILFHLLVFIIKAQFTYTSSLNILLLTAATITMFIFSKTSILKKFAVLLAIIAGGILVFNYSSPLTKFKINQAGSAFAEVIKGDVSAIPKSPRVRVLEVMISYENLKESGIPFLILGKGFGSYIDDNETGYFNKYEMVLNDDDYSPEEISQKRFKKGHGGIPYLPIKVGLIGVAIFALYSLMSITIIRKEQVAWLGVAVPFYLITTFSYGMKNFIFVGISLGLVLAIKHGRYDEAKDVYN